MPPTPVASSTKKSKAKATALVATSTLNANGATMQAKVQTPVGQNYEVIDLGTLGGNNSSAAGINASGQVVGYSTTASGTQHAFLYSRGVMQDLGTLGGDSSYAYGISASGQVAGASATASGTQRAFLYSGGVMQNLGTLGGNSVAFGINDSGQIVGSYISANTTHAFLYANGSMQDIGVMDSAADMAQATGINNNGQISGSSRILTNGLNMSRAFLYSNGSMVNLGTLGTGSFANGLNGDGQVVGDASTVSGAIHSFLYSDGTMQDLGTLGGNASYAFGINGSGQVVGYSRTSDGASHAFLYSGDVMQDLNSLVIQQGSGWTFTQANAINDAGEIVGSGTNPDGAQHAFKLKPLPLGSIQAIQDQPAMPVFSTPIVKGVGKDNLIIITHGWNPSWYESDTSWVDRMSNSISGYLNNRGMTNWQVNGYKWVPKATTFWPSTAIEHAQMEGNNLGLALLQQGWQHVHLIGHSAGAALINNAAKLICYPSGPTVQCTFLDPYLGPDKAGITNYGKYATWADSYYTRDGVTGQFTEGCLSNAFNTDVTQLDVTNRYGVTKYYSSQTGQLEPCYVTESVHGWPVDFYQNTITGNSVTPDYSVFGFPLSLEGGGFSVATSAYPAGNNPANLLGIPDPNCNSGFTVTPPKYPDYMTDYTTWPNLLQSPTGTIQKGNASFKLFSGSPAWVATVVDSTNMLNTVSFDAQFTSNQGAQGLLSVYWDADTVGYLDERMIEPGLAHYTFTFPNANANTAHLLGFRLDPFTNIQSVVDITNIALNADGPTEPFTLSVTTNKVGGLQVFQLNGQAGFEYGVQMSTNLAGTNWTHIATLVNTNGVVDFYDPNSASSTMRFYRAAWLR